LTRIPDSKQAMRVGVTTHSGTALKNC
jgi:hypothetical protein